MEKQTNTTVDEGIAKAAQVEAEKILGDADIKDMSFDDALEKIRANVKMDPTQQYKKGGKIYQRVAKFRPHGRSLVFVSIVVNHTPDSKYTGEKLRELRAKRAGK